MFREKGWEMKPILFSDEMVRSILDGRKTQTRRPVKNYEFYSCLTGDCPHDHKDQCAKDLSEQCPFGRVGDRLWVREAFTKLVPGEHIIYRANYKDPNGIKWSSSSTMSEGQSRLTLRIKSVRVERLWKIRSDDAIKEGFSDPSPLDAFFDCWNSIYGKGPFRWGNDPFVWVIDFEKESV